MKIKIRENATSGYNGVYPKFAKMLEQVRGMTLEVETEYLFMCQFNTAPIPGISESGMRIMDIHVEEIFDDMRNGRQKCRWCGKHSEERIGYPCPYCGYNSFESFYSRWKGPHFYKIYYFHKSARIYIADENMERDGSFKPKKFRKYSDAEEFVKTLPALSFHERYIIE